MPTKSEIIEKLASSLRAVIDRPDNYGSTPYNLLAESAFNALSEYVTFLEEGSQLQVGDAVIAEQDHLLPDGRKDFTSTNVEWFVRADVHPFRVKKIILRAGVPVITLQKE